MFFGLDVFSEYLHMACCCKRTGSGHIPCRCLSCLSVRFDDEVVRATEENAVETAQVRAAMIKQRQVKDDTFLVQDDEITWVPI